MPAIVAEIGEDLTGAGAIEADVVVVGAGPGGSATAYHLAASGLRVALLEKGAFRARRSAATGSRHAR